jgi:hypothetical protein
VQWLQVAGTLGLDDFGLTMLAELCQSIDPERRGTRYDARVIRKLASGKYRLYSRKRDPETGKRRNLGTFASRAAAERHERAVQFFKRR